MLLTACLCVAVFAGFYAIGRRERPAAAVREVAPLRLPVSASSVAVPDGLGGAPQLALTSPPPPVTPVVVASSPPPATSTLAKARVVVAPSVRAPAPVQHTTPAGAPSSAPSAPSGGTPASRHSAPTNEGSGTSFDSSG